MNHSAEESKAAGATGSKEKIWPVAGDASDMQSRVHPILLSSYS